MCVHTRVYNSAPVLKLENRAGIWPSLPPCVRQGLVCHYSVHHTNWSTKLLEMILSLLSCVEETELQTVLPCTRFLYRFWGSEPGSSCLHDNAVSTEPLSQYKFSFLKRTQLGECLLHMLEALSSILSTT